MPRFLNPTGRRTYQLVHCDRCARKLFASQVRSDGDNPALKVCRACRDSIDPWKLPPRKADDYAVPGATPNTILQPEPEA